MRVISALLLILSMACASAFAAQKKGATAPAQTPKQSAEQIYLDSEVAIDEINQFARDQDGIAITGTIQNFYPNGRLAWETQWVNGRLHGITRGYYENRKIKEETTWVNGKLNGPARWYNAEGTLLRETVYENDKDLKDLTAPDAAQKKDGAADQGNAPAASPQ